MTGPMHGTTSSRPGKLPRIDSRGMLILVAAVIAGLAAWRATLGMSLIDDGYYAAATVRLAQGARLFVDEMFVQSLGFLVAVPFTKLWLWLFGTTGVVIALRLFYVAIAVGASWVLYRVLRPSFSRWTSFAAAVALFIAPAYNLLAVSYDTMAALGMVMASVFAFAAVRDEKRKYAAVAGAAAAFASISYPPLAIASVALLLTFAWRTRGRGLVGSMVLGAAGVVGVFAAWLLATTSVAEIRTFYEFVTGSWKQTAGPSSGTRSDVHLWRLMGSLVQVWVVPLFMWFIPAAVISYWTTFFGRAPGRERARGIALAALPVALVLPVLANWAALGGQLSSLGTIGGNFLIAFVLFVAPPMFTSLLRMEGDQRRDMALMALPAGILGFAVIIASSSADIFWASGIVGLGPIVVTVIVWWAVELGRVFGPNVEAASVASLLLALLVLLFGYGFKTDGPPLGMPETVSTGAYAGVQMSEQRAAEIEDLTRLAKKWVGPNTTVTVVDMPGAYLVTGGIPLTNVVWLDPGPFDAFTVKYLDRAGRWPDVVFVPLSRLNQPEEVIEASPFLSAVVKRYTLVERSEVSGVAVFTAGTVEPATR